MDITLAGVSAVVLVTLLVQGAKLLGFHDKYAPHLALALSLIAAIVAQLIVVFPGIEPWVTAIVGGFLVWLTSQGLYHTVKNMTGNDHTSAASAQNNVTG